MTENIKKNKLAITLIISIIANALLVGVIVGKETHKQQRPIPPKRFELLTKEEVKQNHMMMEQAKADLEIVFLKKDYTKEKGLIALKRFDKRMNATRAIMHMRIATKAEELAPHDRLQLLHPHRYHRKDRRR